MDKMIVSSSPHFSSSTKTQNIMLDVIIAMVPAMIASVVIFGMRSALIILVCVASCVLSEFLSRKVMKRNQTVQDLSCVVTGILLALNLPVSISPIIAAFGGVIAIVVVKQMFGGIGQNFVNPALTARIILMNSFPAKMTNWTAPFSADAVTTASPLGILKEGTGAALPSYMELFLGNNAGSWRNLRPCHHHRRGIPDSQKSHKPGYTGYISGNGCAVLTAFRPGSADGPAFGGGSCWALCLWLQIIPQAPSTQRPESFLPLAAECLPCLSASSDRCPKAYPTPSSS